MQVAEPPFQRRPPYPTIAQRLQEGRVVPFLGAGASLLCREPPDHQFSPDDGKYLPSTSELANILAEDSSFPSKDERDLTDLAKVSSYYVDASGREPLRDRLRQLLSHRKLEPGAIHRLLAAMKQPILVVTTNYDTLLEQAFDEAGKPYDQVVYPADQPRMAKSVLVWEDGKSEPKERASNTLVVEPGKRSVIFKMHGTTFYDRPKSAAQGGQAGGDETSQTQANPASLLAATKAARPDHYVITEEDYIEFLTRMGSQSAIPPNFFPHFQRSHFLFLGYGLRDWNLRLLLKNMRNHLSRRDPDVDSNALKSWAIQLSPSELEKELWKQRGVNIFDAPLDTFAGELRRLMGI
jgi:hypothetical protein